MKCKKELKIWGISFVFAIILMSYPPHSSASDPDRGIPVYKPPVHDTEIFRREGGDIGNYSVVRSMT